MIEPLTLQLAHLPMPTYHKTALSATFAYIEKFTSASQSPLGIDRRNVPPSIFQIARGLNIDYQAARWRVEMLQLYGWIKRDLDRGVIELKGVS